MRLSYYSAHIVVDGKELEEYDIVQESPTKMTCWIASEEGKNFGVKWECHKKFSTVVSGEVIIDGLNCGRSHTRRPGYETVAQSSVLSGTTLRDFMFSRVQLTDDDSFLEQEVPKELGDICLRLKHGKVVKKLSSTSVVRALSGNAKFHERAKKATVHCVGFGPQRAVSSHLSLYSFIPDDDPYLDLVFKYRPLAILQANGIAPIPTPPERGMVVDEIDAATVPKHDAEYPEIKPFEVKERIRKLEDELKRLRDMDSSTSEDRKPKRVKKEEPGPRKRPLFTPGEVIDLT